MNINQQKRMQLLVFKCVVNLLTPDESVGLQEMISREPGISELIRRMRDVSRIRKALEMWDKIDVDKGRAKFLARLRNEKRRET